MKTKHYLLLLCASIFAFLTTSCSKDDEGEPVVEIITTVSNLEGFAQPTDNDQFMRLVVNATAEFDYVGMAIRVKYANNPGDIIPGFQDRVELVKESNQFNGNFLIPIYDLLEDDLKVTLEVAQFSTNENDSYRQATGITNPITIIPEFPTEPITSIHLVSVTTNPETSTWSGKLNFSMNTKEGPGELNGQVYQDGTLIGEPFSVTILGEAGQANIPENSGVGIGTYQVLFKNTSITNPIYTFVDAEGMIIEGNSVLLEFEVLPEEEVTPESQSFVNITTMSFEAKMEISKNFSEPRDITVQLLSPGGTVIDSDVFTTTGAGNETFSIPFPTADSGITLNSNTTYTVQWLFNGNEFWNADVTTASSGSFNVVFGVVDEITPNSGRIQIIYTNTTNNDVESMLTFNGVDTSSNAITSELPITIPAGSVNQVMYQVTAGYKQNSQVNFDLIINGSPLISSTFDTTPITYGNEAVTNPNDPGMPITINAGQNNQTEFALEFNANGTGIGSQFVFVMSSVANTDPTGIIDNISIGSSPNVDVTWIFDGSTGEYTAVINQIENIVNGNNTYSGGIGAENYTVTETFELKVILVDDNGLLVGENMLPIQLNAEL